MPIIHFWGILEVFNLDMSHTCVVLLAPIYLKHHLHHDSILFFPLAPAPCFTTFVLKHAQKFCIVWNFLDEKVTYKFLSISEHISGSIEPVTLFWVLLERSFPPGNVSIDEANFGQR